MGSENATQVIFAKEAKECNAHPVDMAMYTEKHPNFVAGTALLVLIAHGTLPVQLHAPLERTALVVISNVFNVYKRVTTKYKAKRAVIIENAAIRK